MENVKDSIISRLKSVLSELGVTGIEPRLEQSKDLTHGDYTSNAAMIVFAKSKAPTSLSHFVKTSRDKKLRGAGKSQKFGTALELATNLKAQRSNIKTKLKVQNFKNPLELATNIRGQISKIKNIERIEVVSPGFINFWLSEDFLVSQLKQVIAGGEKVVTKGKTKGKIMVEFTDPNPFKEFHAGHLYSNTIGESICRLLEFQGNEVKRACYQGDVGMHVAKALYGLLQITDYEFRITNLETKSPKERVEFLGKCYAAGAKAYEEDELAKKEINDLNSKIYRKSDTQINELYQKGRQWSLDYFESIYQRLGTRFDYYYFESEASKLGTEIVFSHLEKGVFKKSDGAIIFEGEKYGLHNRVFINSLGLPTYEAKELGLAPAKYKDFPYDLSIIITGNEINEYFKVLLKALSLVSPVLSSKTKHIGHGMVRLPTGKMSSRTGSVITGEWLLDEAKRRITKAFPKVDGKTADLIAVGAVKYALLKVGVGRDIAFDFDASISLEGDSGPYLQYTFARTQSVLAKVKSQKSKVKDVNQKNSSLARSHLARLNDNFQLNEEEFNLLRLIYRFSEIAEQAGQNFSPNILCSYLFDLAKMFNLFYQKHRILGEIGVKPLLTRDVQDFRVVLTQEVGQVIKNGLYLLGISSPEKI